MHDIKGKWNTLTLMGDRCCSYNNMDFNMTDERVTVVIHVLSLCKITVGMNYRAV